MSTIDQPVSTGDQLERGRRFERIASGFRSLHNRNFRIYWLSQLISLVGSWMQTTAQAWLVLEITHSPFAIGLITTLQFLPMMLLSLFGGVIADRFPKHRLILITQTALLIQAAIFGLLAVTHSLQLWHLYVLALILGTINAIDQPTRQSFVSELVDREDLVNAVGLNSMQFNAARIIGPAVAGITIAKFGAAPALIFNAVSFLAVIVGLLMMNPQQFHAARTTERRGVLESVAEGLSYVRRTPQVLLILLVVAAVGTFGFNFTVILPLLGGFVLHTDAEGFGLLSAFVGVGALLAAIGTAFAREMTLRRLLVASLAFGIILAVLALVPVFWISAALLVALGIAGITFATTANTLLQLSVPGALRGRVMGIYTLLFIGSTPIGALLIGWLSSTFSVPVTLLICGILCIAGVGGALIYRARTTA